MKNPILANVTLTKPLAKGIHKGILTKTGVNKEGTHLLATFEIDGYEYTRRFSNIKGKDKDGKDKDTTQMMVLLDALKTYLWLENAADMVEQLIKNRVELTIKEGQYFDVVKKGQTPADDTTDDDNDDDVVPERNVRV